MLMKLRLISLSLSSGLLLLLMLCLGSQNLSERHNLNLIIKNSAEFPTGFLVGISVVLGVISGGCSASLLTSNKKE
mgnify:CR=1 FL=1